MSTKADVLRKHYDRLQPLERFRLVLAAEARGDESEMIALRDSAPRGTYKMMAYPYRGMWEGLEHVITAVVTDTLGLGCGLLLSRLRHALHCASGPAAVEDDTAVETWEHAGDFASEIVAVEEGFRRFCAQQGVTVEQVMAAPWPWKESASVVRRIAAGMIDMEREAVARMALLAGLDPAAELDEYDQAQAAQLDERATKYAAVWQELWMMAQGAE